MFARLQWEWYFDVFLDVGALAQRDAQGANVFKGAYVQKDIDPKTAIA